MKSWEIAVRAKRFELAEKTRKADDLKGMVRDFETMAADLDRQILAEEERTGVKDQTHFSYSTFAKAATLRRDKLLVSVADLKLQLESAVIAQQAARDALTTLEADEARGAARSNHGKMERNGVAYG
jgi:flagellar protein FliJ